MDRNTSTNLPVEVDFLGLDNPQRQQVVPPNYRRQSSIRDIQKAAARLSPGVLRSVIAGNNTNPGVPVSPSPLRAKSPLTIIYNGNISVFNATPDVADVVFKMASEGNIIHHNQQERGILRNDFSAHQDMLPLFRKKSLQRFLEKRRERLISVAPYPASSSSSVGDVDESVDQTCSNNISELKQQQQQKKKGVKGPSKITTDDC